MEKVHDRHAQCPRGRYSDSPARSDLIVGTHGRSIYIADDITPLEHLKPSTDKEITLFDPRPATLWKNDPQAQRHATNRQFQAKNPQGGTAIQVLAKSDMGAGKVEFLLNNVVASTMDVQIKAGMNRFQWSMRGPAPPAPANDGGRGGRGGGGGRGGVTGVPFVANGGRGGGGGGGFGFGAPLGALLEPGTYMVRLTVGGQTLTSSVTVLEDIWMRPQ